MRVVKVLLPLAVVLACVAEPIGASAATTGVAPAWTIHGTGQIGELNSVSCTAADACTAVGAIARGSIYYTLAQRWDGVSWVDEETSYQADLYGVSCASVDQCLAIGNTGYNTGPGTGRYRLVAEAWNGAIWKETPAPIGGQLSELLSDSCATVSTCTAVGLTSTPSADDPAAESWNGRGWASEGAANPSGSTDSELFSVSCSNADACTAVGFEFSLESTPLAESRNGTAWTIQSTVTPGGSQAAHFEGVSCRSAWACVAVGEYVNSANAVLPLAEKWNGRNWAITSLPAIAGAIAGNLDAVSCSRTTACTAVGAYSVAGGITKTLAETWNGSSWALQPTPNFPTAQVSILTSIWCSTYEACTAVGGWHSRHGEWNAFAEQYS